MRKCCCCCCCCFYPLSSLNTLHIVFLGTVFCAYLGCDIWFLWLLFYRSGSQETDDVCFVFSCNNTFKYIVVLISVDTFFKSFLKLICGMIFDKVHIEILISVEILIFKFLQVRNSLVTLVSLYFYFECLFFQYILGW